MRRVRSNKHKHSISAQNINKFSIEILLNNNTMSIILYYSGKNVFKYPLYFSQDDSSNNIAKVPLNDVCGGCEVISTKTASQLRISTNSQLRFYSIIILCPSFSTTQGKMFSNIPYTSRKTTVATI